MSSSVKTTIISINQPMASKNETPLGVVWVENSIFVLYFDGDLYRWEEEQWVQRRLPTREDCRRTESGNITLLPDGRLAILQICVMNTDRYQILAYDWTQNKSEVLYDLGTKGAGNFITNPSMTKFAYQTIRTFSNLYWITSEGFETIPTTLKDGNKTWYLPDTTDAELRWQADPTLSNKKIYESGLLTSAQWSPDGNWIAVAGTLDPKGKPLQTLGYYKWNIYLIDPETLESRTLVSQVGDGSVMAWSPDSQWLAYKEGADGLWIINIGSGEHTKIYDGQISSGTWAPNGEEILIVACSVPTCREYELLILDISSVVKKS